MTDDINAGIDHQELLRMTTDIVSSFVTNNSIPSESLPDLIRNVHATVSDISGGTAEPEVKNELLPGNRTLT